MAALRVTLLTIHIISAGIWIAQLVAGLAFISVLQGSRGKPIELPLMMAEVRVLSTMGRVGSYGVLLSGLGLLWVNGQSFLNMGGFTPTWLLLKQILYLGAMFILFAVIMPAQNRILPRFIEAARGTPMVTPEIRRLNTRILWGSQVINLLVVVSILLAVWKPE